MNMILIGDKSKFALEAIVVPNKELDDESIFWGDNYSHGNLFVYLNGKKFGEERFFYPIDPTPDDAHDSEIADCIYSGFMSASPQIIFNSFEFARDNNPDIDFYQLEEYSVKEINQILDYVNKETQLDEFIPNFLEKYIASDCFSEFSNGIGSYCLNRLHKLLFRYGENVRFILIDKDANSVGDVALSVTEYRKVWGDMLSHLSVVRAKKKNE